MTMAWLCAGQPAAMLPPRGSGAQGPCMSHHPTPHLRRKSQCRNPLHCLQRLFPSPALGCVTAVWWTVPAPGSPPHGHPGQRHDPLRGQPGTSPALLRRCLPELRDVPSRRGKGQGHQPPDCPEIAALLGLAGRACACTCMCVCMCAYVRTSVCMHMHTHVCLCSSVCCVCMHVCMSVLAHANTCAHVLISVHCVCMHVCMHTHAHMCSNVFISMCCVCASVHACMCAQISYTCTCVCAQTCARVFLSVLCRCACMHVWIVCASMCVACP